MKDIKSKENISADQYATDKITTGSKSIKTKVRKALKRSIKTIKKAHKTTKATIKTTKTMIKTTRAMIKLSIKAVKLTIKGTIAAIKGLIAAIKGISAAIAAGGWAAVVIILIICIIALIIAGILGAFDLDNVNSLGKLPEEVLEELIEDYKLEIEQDYRSQFPDMEVLFNTESFDLINREYVIAVFKVRVIYENCSMISSLKMDYINTKILEDTLREMYLIELNERESEEAQENIIKEIDINLVEVPLEDVFLTFKFDEYQREMFDLFLENSRIS